MNLTRALPRVDRRWHQATNTSISDTPKPNCTRNAILLRGGGAVARLFAIAFESRKCDTQSGIHSQRWDHSSAACRQSRWGTREEPRNASRAGEGGAHNVEEGPDDEVFCQRNSAVVVTKAGGIVDMKEQGEDSWRNQRALALARDRVKRGIGLAVVLDSAARGCCQRSAASSGRVAHFPPTMAKSKKVHPIVFLASN